ncbi:carbon-nitrogen hydrolase family protein [Actinomadura luteofluorescens]|uniref:carbon-nitrogen hydrolase family protein n=1 Tax=Actinomadura luteofluorescens TaxID=46163 RepID=UPI002164030A|nr:carbon-nitrogen hydrolase family protein [Actinomadura glauciflava]MCR3742991.1 putative amidohydrolase [Actinomadura glauciflava]
MPEPLTLAAVQPPSTSHDVAANVAEHVLTIHAVHSRVVLFPELSLTGYELDAQDVVPDDPRLEPLIKACASSNTVALVGAPVGGSIAMLRVDSTGITVAYRKMWLGHIEVDHFEPGEKPAVITVDGRRLGLAICKDTGVRRHAADTAALGVDAYLGGVCEDDADVLANRSRRIAAEHGVWVAFASFAGMTGGGYEPAAGCSSIRTPAGLVAAQAGPEPGGIARAVLV